MDPTMKLPTFSLANITTAVLSAGTALIVLGVLPLTENVVDDTKMYALFLTTIIVGIIFSVSVIRRGAIEFILSKLTYATLGFLAATAASTFFLNQYPVKALLSFGGLFIATSALVLFASPLLTKTSKRVWLATYNIVAVILVLSTLLELMGVGPSRLLPLIGPFAPAEFPVLFNLSGSIVSALQLCIIGAVGIFSTWMATRKAQAAQFGAVVIMLIGILVYGYYLLPGKSSMQLASFGASWSIALDSVRDPRGALIGVGTGAYQVAYQRYKPLWMNTTPSWNSIFGAGANMPLTLLTISGFLGLASWLTLTVLVFKEVRKVDADEAQVVGMLLSTFALQLIFPPNVTVSAIQAILLALFISSRRHKSGVLHFSFFNAKVHRLTQVLPGRSAEPRWPLYLTSGVMITLLSVSAYFLGRFYVSAHYSLVAVEAYQENDAIAVYTNQQKAVAFNPYLDVNHRRYATTAVSIAEALSQKTEKTTQDTTSISELIQQAVREGQSAVTLNPADAQNVALLASIYQRLIGGVDGAETFAEQYFVQAVNLYPSSPDIYIALAGIYLRQEKWEQAVGILNQGLRVKSDYPNTLFNLGFALEKLNDLANAKSAYERSLSYITDTNGEDYLTISKKIEELDGILKEQKAAAEKQAAAVPGSTTTPPQNQNPSAVELNLNNPSQSLTSPLNDVQVNQQTLPTSEPVAPTATE